MVSKILSKMVATVKHHTDIFNNSLVKITKFHWNQVKTILQYESQSLCLKYIIFDTKKGALVILPFKGRTSGCTI